jgi:antirestriction protein
MSRSKHDAPRIYVADLAAYNAGRLHGEWIDATQDPDQIHEEIQAMLKKSPEPDAEEWAIHDFENFGGLQLSESEDMDKVSQVAKLIEEHGPLFAEVVSHFGGTQYLDDAVEAMEENYQGGYDDLADWAEQFAKDTGASMENYENYIDWERVGNDAEMGGDIFTVEVDGKVHVFFSR